MRIVALGSGCLAALALVMTGRPSAQPLSADVAIRAVVPKYCTAGGRRGPVDVPVVIRTDAAGAVIGTATTVTVSGVVCNTAADLTITAPSGGVAPAAWRAEVTFAGATATLKVGGGTIREAGASAGSVRSTPGPARGTLTIAIRPDSRRGLEPLAEFRDTLRVMLVPR